MRSIKRFVHKIGLKFNKGSLVVEQNKYATEIVNSYIVYEWDTWSKIPLDDFTLIYCLFGETKIKKFSNKEKWVFSSYWIVFCEKGLWSFGNDFARNIILFSVDNISSSHSDNGQINFLVLVEGPTSDINGSFSSPEKK